MFDFAGVIGNSVLKVQFISCGFCPLAIIIQKIHKKGLFIKRKQEARME